MAILSAALGFGRSAIVGWFSSLVVRIIAESPLGNTPFGLS
jgi:hypothetical protein